jgi:hypothetical protein
MNLESEGMLQLITMLAQFKPGDGISAPINQQNLLTPESIFWGAIAVLAIVGIVWFLSTKRRRK